MSIFLVISFCVEHQAWFRVRVVPLVPITFASSVLWLDVIDVRLHLHETSWQMCRDHHLHSERFQDINRIHDERYHPYPLIIWAIIDNIIAFPPTRNLFLFCVVSWFPCYLALVMFYLVVLLSSISRMLWGLLHLLRILDIVILLAISIPFLIPVLFLTWIPTIELWRVNSELLATLLLWIKWSIVSFFVYWLSDHHTNIDHAT